MSDLSVMPAPQAGSVRAKSLPDTLPSAVAIPPPNQATRGSTPGSTPYVSTPSKTDVASAWELAATEETPDGVELDLIPFTDDGAILSDDLPQAPPPPAPKEAPPVKEEKEPVMDSPKPYGFDPHPKTEQTRSKEAARVYEEERVISNAPRPEAIKPKWEQAAPVKAKFDALKDAEIAEVLD